MPVITFIANYPEMIEVIEEVFATQASHAHLMRQPHPYQLEIISAASTDLVLDKKLNGDVVIARGGIVYDLKRVNYHLPIVEVFVAGSDLLVSLNEAKQKYGPLPTAIIGSANMIAGIEQISDAMGFFIKPYYLTENSVGEVVRNVELAKSEGMQTIIGGSNGCKHARNLGLHAVLIRSGRESIWLAIAEAKRVADISVLEQTKTLMFKTIMDYAYEGIIAIDSNQTVLVFNDIGQKILKLDKNCDYTGKHLDAIITNRELSDLIKSERDTVDDMVRIGDMFIAFNNVPVMLNGQQVGRVFTFQNVTRLQELEGKIRGKIFTRGHRAKYSLADIHGESTEIVRAKHTASRYATIDSNVLIIGETGTGKELFAQSIHGASSRKHEPFVAVNCAALSENLLESELFGYVEGAFTGAAKGGKKGLFEVAHNGTIFLDEISEIPMSLQGKLLRVIQEREVMRLGSDRILPIDVRIISATNKELRNLIASGGFREDLYYRLNVFNIRIPALRQRSGDILLLVKEFLTQFSHEYGKSIITCSKQAEELLVRYSWPGNIRELRNMCERLAALVSSETITAQDILDQLHDQYIDPSQSNLVIAENTKQSLGEQERLFFEEALQRSCWNKSKTAAMLGISRVTLWRKLKELGIE